ncbi:glucan 1,3-beta-glucosidase precursor [Sclerotinia borealis F-4128]|uniref:glucan 1,3-beta-glucosidase n=1 Tax=Sclerotinia borealis (strain F-4128) TaxID=1432307 RepID=W9CWQ6_SCLBF|nr:glucan 1,3-beta-glucosidase precursor [Sclerotinia borealis F-4128]
MVSSFKTLFIAVCLLMIEATPLLKKKGLSFDYNGGKVRGVNLGGWFVLEPWITPSLFYGSWVDEYTLTQTLGKSASQNLLNAHWATWITQHDFNEIASVGLNHVRIPIGYWALNPLPGDPYVQGQLQYLDQAIGWARQAGLKVILDVHGAPGSQNGFDNSGRKGPVTWTQGDTTKQTLAAIQSLAYRYAPATDVVTGIELLNEPASWDLDMGAVKQFYYDGWGNVRNANPDTAVVIHDAFLSPPSWNGFMNYQSGVNDIILDTHIYQIFSFAEVAMKPCQHVQVACSQIGNLANTDKWTIVGEFSGAQTDCAKWLNGFGVGSRYDGSYPGSYAWYGSCQTKDVGTVDGLLEIDKVNLAYFMEAQLDAYEAHSGWVFWTWKTESAPEWHFQNLTRAGLIPQPLTSRKYGKQCATSTCLIPDS